MQRIFVFILKHFGEVSFWKKKTKTKQNKRWLLLLRRLYHNGLLPDSDTYGSGFGYLYGSRFGYILICIRIVKDQDSDTYVSRFGYPRILIRIHTVRTWILINTELNSDTYGSGFG
jgi:hypothetical protein